MHQKPLKPGPISGARARHRRGTETVEYGLVLALIVVAAIVVLSELGGKIERNYSSCADAIDDAEIATGGASASPPASNDPSGNSNNGNNGDNGNSNNGDNGNHGNGNNGDNGNHGNGNNGDNGNHGNGNNGKGKSK